MSSTPARRPCLAAALVFSALAILIARFAVAPLGASDLLGIAACAASAGAAATLAFTLRAPTPSVLTAATAPALDTAALVAQIAAAVDTRLAASADHRRDELLRAAYAASTQSLPTPDTDTIAAPAGTKPRLGRGLLGLMHAPSAITLPPAPAAPSSATPEDDTRAAG
jgi:hypothetical protein